MKLKMALPHPEQGTEMAMHSRNSRSARNKVAAVARARGRHGHTHEPFDGLRKGVSVHSWG